MEWKKPTITTFESSELSTKIAALASSVAPTFEFLYSSGLWNGYKGWAQGNVRLGNSTSYQCWYVDCYTVSTNYYFRSSSYNGNLFKYIPDTQTACWLDY